MLEGSKCLQLRIVFADEGSARMMVFVPDAGRVRRVASWQWLDFDWEIMTRSGSGRSAREVRQGGVW
jgi:hypothetical protein